MSSINWSKTREKYRGQWVAFKDDEKTVVANGKSPKEVKEKATKNGYKNPILAHMPKDMKTFVGSYEIFL